MRRVDRRSRRLLWSVLALFAGAVVLGKEFAAGPGAVGVSGEGEDFGVVTSRSIIAAATTLSLNASPHGPKGKSAKISRDSLSRGRRQG
jgi:hypothetical protein